MANGAFVVREDGSRQRSVSIECPRCGHLRIESSTSPSPDFSEDGWHYAASFTCLNAKCRHKWSEKIVVATGGFTVQHH
jgi:hypothetical protein